MNVVLASHTYMGGPFVVGSHQLSRAAARLGHRPLHVSTPLSAAHLLRFWDPGVRARLRRLGYTGNVDGISSLGQVVPFSVLPAKAPLVAPGRNLSLRTMVVPLQRTLRAHGIHEVDLLLIDQPMFSGLRELLRPRRMLYRPTDLYAEMMNDERVLGIEAAVLREADGVVSTSAPVDQRMSELAPPGLPRLLLENGVEYEHFATPRSEPVEYRAIPSPRAIYVGAIDARLDLDGVLESARATSDVSFVFIGPAPSAGQSPANVHFLGVKSYDAVPGYLQHADVALLPLNEHPANVGRSPMKLYEYLAAGLPVLARATPELARRRLEGVTLYAESGDLAARLPGVLTAGPLGESARAAARAASWAGRFQTLLSFVQEMGD